MVLELDGFDTMVQQLANPSLTKNNMYMKPIQMTKLPLKYQPKHAFILLKSHDTQYAFLSSLLQFEPAQLPLPHEN